MFVYSMCFIIIIHVYASVCTHVLKCVHMLKCVCVFHFLCVSRSMICCHETRTCTVCVCVCVHTKLLVQIKSLGVFSEDLKVIESLQHSTRNYHSNVYFLKNYTYESLATYNLMQVTMYTMIIWNSVYTPELYLYAHTHTHTHTLNTPY